MARIEEDTIGGFNTFLRDQQDGEGTATVSLYEFNTNVENFYQIKPIEDAPELDNESYNPGGQTALHDAITVAIDETGDLIEGMAEAERPDNVIVVVLTDGKENASETPQETVRERVKSHREDEGWEFLFIGANQDAALTASGMGMDTDKSLNMSHSGEGARAAQTSTSEQIHNIRREGSTGGFDDEDRQRQDEADES